MISTNHIDSFSIQLPSITQTLNICISKKNNNYYKLKEWIRRSFGIKISYIECYLIDLFDNKSSIVRPHFFPPISLLFFLLTTMVIVCWVAVAVVEWLPRLLRRSGAAPTIVGCHPVTASSPLSLSSPSSHLLPSSLFLFPSLSLPPPMISLSLFFFFFIIIIRPPII